MIPSTSVAHYAILTAMLAPAFFLTATASLLMSANSRLARVIDRARTLVKELEASDSDEERRQYDALLALQRRRSHIILRGSQLLYVAITFFVGTSLTVAGDAWLGYRFPGLPTALAACGVVAMFAASLLLAREASLAVAAVSEEIAHGHQRASRPKRTPAP